MSGNSGYRSTKSFLLSIAYPFHSINSPMPIKTKPVTKLRMKFRAVISVRMMRSAAVLTTNETATPKRTPPATLTPTGRTSGCWFSGQ